MAIRKGSLAMPGWESTVGTKSRTAVLDDEKAWLIYNSPLSESKLAKKFGVSKSTIHGIKAGNRWRHATVDRSRVEQTADGLAG